MHTNRCNFPDYKGKLSYGPGKQVVALHDGGIGNVRSGRDLWSLASSRPDALPEIHHHACHEHRHSNTGGGFALRQIRAPRTGQCTNVPGRAFFANKPNKMLPAQIEISFLHLHEGCIFPSRMFSPRQTSAGRRERDGPRARHCTVLRMCGF